MSTIQTNSITDAAGTGAPDFPNGIEVSAGNVLIGTSTSVSNNRLVIDQASGDGANSGFLMQRNGATGTSFKIDIDSSDVANFRRGVTNAMSITSSGNVGIGTASPSFELDIQAVTDPTVRIYSTGTGVSDDSLLRLQIAGTTASNYIQFGDSADSDAGYIKYDHTSNSLAVGVNAAERMRIDSSGNLLVGKASADATLTGVEARSDGFFIVTRDLPTAGSDTVSIFDRKTSTGEVIRLRKDGTTVGVIGVGASNPYIGSGDTTLTFAASGDVIIPTGTDGATRSGSIDLGNSANRWDTVFATVGTINTSDRTEKQDIEELNDAERRVAVACKGLLRKYRLKSAVALKGEDARIHFGIIAQDLQAAFEAEGLDAGRYGMFIHSTWTDEETGEEKSLMGVRYSELLAFMIAAL